MKSVKLSILMAAYNEETTIGLAIEEVLNADCRAFTAPGFSGVTPSISPIGTPPGTVFSRGWPTFCFEVPVSCFGRTHACGTRASRSYRTTPRHDHPAAE